MSAKSACKVSIKYNAPFKEPQRCKRPLPHLGDSPTPSGPTPSPSPYADGEGNTGDAGSDGRALGA